MPLVSKAFGDIITFTRASTGSYFDSAGVLQSAAINAPRLDYNPSTLAAQGLLIEEQRTNSIRNNTMAGAVAGTPGTEPTNWASSTTGLGITRTIVGVGVENGITYVDYRFAGTPSAGSNVAIACELTNGIAAASGQTWTESIYLKLVGGSFTNTTTTLSLLGTDGTNGTEAFSSATITSTLTNLSQCRLSLTGTLAVAGTTNIQPRVRIGYTVGVAIDITLRIGLPQLELGAFATSVIPTTTAAVTRSADVASVNTLSPWFNALSGTLYAEYQPGVTAQTLGAVSFSDGTNNNRMIIRAMNTSSETRFIGASGGVLQWNDGFLTATVTATKSAFAYATNDIASTRNGATPVADTLATIPTVNRLVLGADADQTAKLNGYLRRITYYPRRLTNAELQTITA